MGYRQFVDILFVDSRHIEALMSTKNQNQKTCGMSRLRIHTPASAILWLLPFFSSSCEPTNKSATVPDEGILNPETRCTYPSQ